MTTSSDMTRPRPTWRQLLKRHGRTFLNWLDTSGRATSAFENITTQLSDYLIAEIQRVSTEISNAPVLFWENIPNVRKCCADLETFEKPLAVEAYAYVHFLERYRRTWRTLEHLVSLAVLPLGTDGVRVLDVGAGPAHSSYAIEDFYAALRDWAVQASVPELVIAPAQLSCLEQSRSMVRFFHRFSEYAERSGPFSSLAPDFQGLDLPAMRIAYRRQNESYDYWDPETEQYETAYEPRSAHEDAGKMFRFRLLVLSNFLTLEEEVERYETELFTLFSDLKAGGVALILGGTSDSYQSIYEKLARVAKHAGLVEGDWSSDELGKSMPEHMAVTRLKLAQNRVYERLKEMVGAEQLKRDVDWPDYWSPIPSSHARTKFALRAFRSGRWPRIGITTRSS